MVARVVNDEGLVKLNPRTREPVAAEISGPPDPTGKPTFFAAVSTEEWNELHARRRHAAASSATLASVASFPWILAGGLLKATTRTPNAARLTFRCSYRR